MGIAQGEAHASLVPRLFSKLGHETSSVQSIVLSGHRITSEIRQGHAVMDIFLVPSRGHREIQHSQL